MADGAASQAQRHSHLPHELRLHILSFLPPNDLALGWRLTCKELAQHLSDPAARTAYFSQPLPPNAVGSTALLEGAAEGLRQLTLRQKLRLLSTAAASGCEANVELAWQLLQPHLFPELLQSEHYYTLLHAPPAGATREDLAHPRGLSVPDVGSAAAASGLAHLLPSLTQRCPGLLDPGRTLEAAAWHCDLAGLDAAWEAVGHRLVGQYEAAQMVLAEDVLEAEQRVEQCRSKRARLQDEVNRTEGELRHLRQMAAGAPDDGEPIDAMMEHAQQRLRNAQLMLENTHYELQHAEAGRDWVPQELRDKRVQRVHQVWLSVVKAAAASSAPDVIAKMEWVLEMGRLFGDHGITEEKTGAWAAAAAAGDMGRVRWLKDRGLVWGSSAAVSAVLEHASMEFIRRLREEGEMPPERSVLSIHGGVCAAARSSVDSAAKVRMYATDPQMDPSDALLAAAERGDVDALQALCRAPKTRFVIELRMPDAVAEALAAAVRSGSVPAASFLHQLSASLRLPCFRSAFLRGNLPMVQWMLHAGCPRGWLSICDLVRDWPSTTTADGERLLQAVQLLQGAGWPAAPDRKNLLAAALQGRQPWSVCCALRQRVRAPVSVQVVKDAAAVGCEAAVAALMQLEVYDALGGAVSTAWYAAAAKNGDRGTLAALRRLGVPLGAGVLAAAVEAGAPLPALRWLVEAGAPWSEAGVAGLVRKARKHCREQERQGVEAWLRGLAGGEAGGAGAAV